MFVERQPEFLLSVMGQRHGATSDIIVCLGTCPFFFCKYFLYVLRLIPFFSRGFQDLGVQTALAFSFTGHHLDVFALWKWLFKHLGRHLLHFLSHFCWIHGNIIGCATNVKPILIVMSQNGKDLHSIPSIIKSPLMKNWL